MHKRLTKNQKTYKYSPRVMELLAIYACICMAIILALSFTPAQKTCWYNDVKTGKLYPFQGKVLEGGSFEQKK